MITYFIAAEIYSDGGLAKWVNSTYETSSDTPPDTAYNAMREAAAKAAGSFIRQCAH